MERPRPFNPEETLKAKIHLAGSLSVGNSLEDIAAVINTTPQEAEVFINQAKQDALRHLTQSLWQENPGIPNPIQIGEALDISPKQVLDFAKESPRSDKTSQARSLAEAQRWNYGLPTKKIAEEFDVAQETIRGDLLKLKKQGGKIKTEKERIRDRNLQFIELRSKNIPIKEIAKIYGTTPNNIYVQIRRMEV